MWQRAFGDTSWHLGVGQTRLINPPSPQKQWHPDTSVPPRCVGPTRLINPSTPTENRGCRCLRALRCRPGRFGAPPILVVGLTMLLDHCDWPLAVPCLLGITQHNVVGRCGATHNCPIVWPSAPLTMMRVRLSAVRGCHVLGVSIVPITLLIRRSGGSTLRRIIHPTHAAHNRIHPYTHRLIHTHTHQRGSARHALTLLITHNIAHTTPNTLPHCTTVSTRADITVLQSQCRMARLHTSTYIHTDRHMQTYNIQTYIHTYIHTD